MRRGSLRLFLILLSLAGGSIAVGTFDNSVGVARAAPALTLVPDHGPCAVLNPPIVVRGSGFPPGLALDLTEQPADAPPRQAKGTVGHAIVGPDGTFTVRGPLGSCAPPVPDGTRFVIEAVDPTSPAAGGYLTVLASATFTKAASATLMLDPDHIPCDSPDGAVTARGSGFAPGTAIVVDAQIDSPEGVVAGRATVGDDGSFAVPLQLRGAIGCDRQYTLDVVPADATGPASPPILASATLIVTGSARQCFPETGKCVGGRFFAYWLAHGGLAINGYPIGDELDQQLADGQTYTVQYFERVRLEYHPENAAPYDMLLGQFGRHLHPADPPVAARDGATFFGATGHTVAPDLLAYWQAHGGLAQFGYPLSEEFQGQLEDGQTYTVQYFERARFERHDGNKPPYNVLLGQFGRRILAETGR